MILCDSGLRLRWGGDVTSAVRLAADAGCEGIYAGRRCGLGELPLLVAAAAGAGLGVPAVAAPLVGAPPAAGRRLPYLAAVDPEERAAAIALCEETFELAAPLGARVATVDAGRLVLGVQRAAVARAFARRELDEDEPGHRLLMSALGERRARSPEILDGLRFALDRLVRAAERRDLTLALEIAADPWQAPTPREAEMLLGAYRGAPLGVIWDGARLDVLAALGTAPFAERRAFLAASARLVRANEAVGLELGFLPGLGDPPGSAADIGGGGRRGRDEDPGEGEGEGAPASPLPAGIDSVVSGRSDSTLAEVRRARELVALAIRRAAPPPASASSASSSTSSPTGAGPTSGAAGGA